MLAAEIRWLASGPTLKMKGTLGRDWAAQARSLVRKDVIPAGLLVDLTEVSYIDTAGEDLLKWLASMGAEFTADSIYAVHVCERLHLPFLENMTARQSAAAHVPACRPHEPLR
jgi:ABC-type transporter Mla MlaB component